MSSLTRTITATDIKLLNAALSKCLTLDAPPHPTPHHATCCGNEIHKRDIAFIPFKGKTMSKVYGTALYQKVLNLKVIQYVQQPETSS